MKQKLPLSNYQLERVNDIRNWYEDVYRPLDGRAPESIRYMTLWAVFNAIYNVADYPRVKLKSVNPDDDGFIKPYIRGRDEDTKLRYISRRIAQDAQFTNSVLREHREFITHLAQRTPEVRQPPGTQSIQFEHDGQSYTLELSELRGIASLDNRVILDNGAVLFQYHHLELEVDGNNLPKDRQKFFRQLVFMLYQLRNNIVHGGSAAFFMRKTELTIGAIKLLVTFVRYLLDHPELLQPDGV